MNRCRRGLALVGLWVNLSLAGAAVGADVQVKMDQLNEREKQLIEKLEAVRQREREIETRLEEVRHRKHELLDKQAAQKPGPPGASPVPTP